jgi:hypothetical protein
LLAVEGDQAIDQRAAREALQARRQRRANGQATAIKTILAELFHTDQRTADFLGEIVGGVDLGTERPDVDGQRLCGGGGRLCFGDVAVLGHQADDGIAPARRFLGAPEWVVIVRTLGQSGEVRHLLDLKILQFLVEVIERGSGDAIGPEAEVDFVQVKLEDFVLVHRALDADGKDRFLELALQSPVARQQEVLGDLLRDGRSALSAAVAALHHVHRGLIAGAEHTCGVDAVVVVEALVLGRKKRADEQIWHRINRHENAPLLRVLRDEGAVMGVNTAHDAGRVFFEALVARQIARCPPQEISAYGRASQKEYDAGCEEKSEDIEQQAAPLAFRLALHGR